MGQRRFKLYTGCRKYGYKVITDKSMNLCDDPECTNCRNIERIFKEEVEKLPLENPILKLDFDKRIGYKKFSRDELKKVIEDVYKEMD